MELIMNFENNNCTPQDSTDIPVDTFGNITVEYVDRTQTYYKQPLSGYWSKLCRNSSNYGRIKSVIFSW